MNQHRLVCCVSPIGFASQLVAEARRSDCNNGFKFCGFLLLVCNDVRRAKHQRS